MQALVLESINQPVAYRKMLVPVARPGEKLVHLYASALNHRDVYISQGKYANIVTPCILGSDGAGMSEGREVVICPSLHWGDDSRVQGQAYEVLGMPSPGTFAEYISVPEQNLFPRPAHLSWEQAAALPLAGLTAWRVLFTRCRLAPGEKVLITGIGGGVALTAMQLALAAGAEVWVTSGSDDKLGRARTLGAAGGANYRDEHWDKRLKELAKGFDVIVDSAGGDGFSRLVGLCNPAARIGIYGGSAGRIGAVSPQILFWKQISILGSTMGTPEEFGQMLEFVERHRIVPVIDSVLPLEDGRAAMDRMDRGDQFGKIVLRIV